MTKTIPVAPVAAATRSGRTSRVQRERSDRLERPIDCAAAAKDIAALSGMIPDAGERIASGARFVLPAGPFRGAAMGQLDTRSDIVSRRSEDHICARVAETGPECDTVVVTSEPADPS